jgi:ABC-2 type transport system ATP-binding protein
LSTLTKEQQEQIIEVAFDQKVTALALKSLENVTQLKPINDYTWEITFTSENDDRGNVFDFAKENGIKILQLNLKSKNLEAIFREKTSKEIKK